MELRNTPPRTSLSEYVLAVLREKIATGELAPGQHLREMELAAGLDVSRGPVRDALALLESEGQVEIKRHRGAFVSVLTQVDVEEVHTFRAAIESLAAERAATRMTPAHFAELDRVLDAMKETSGSVAPQEAVRLDLAFHDVLYDAADHQRLSRAWISIRSQVFFFLHTRNVNFPDFPTVGYPEHHDLRMALAKGDPAVARAAAEEHLSGAYTRLRQLELPTESDRPR
ncbi:GntR family transcriptional regulator [Occultella glacieicola]|uniref:GntR family transcriptional regulator n=1 Tax=Occultella glacieicola TaxID=2518684 RepID=A0ABY2E579_9MICO|nr:GntR family transcriptional regulator [Occultella glacieicola]TDE94958.1 GntR family transcriptional regulator [Occultella glacieicola]